MKVKLKTYRFHWLDGKIEESTGFDLAHAFRSLGCGAGAVKNLDYWEEVKEQNQPHER